MTRHLARLGLGALLLAWAAPVAAQNDQARRNLSGERFATSMTVRPDGSVDVREEIVIRFGRERTTRFERTIKREGADAIVDVAALMEGHPVPEGREPGQVEISGDRTVRVRWRFEAVSNATRSFALTYRLSRAVVPRGGRALVRWAAVPPRRAYAIAQASLSFDAPEGRVYFDGTGVEEAGWVVARRGAGFVAQRDALARREGGTFVAEFSTDGLELVEPQWWFNQQRAASLMPAFLAGGLFILVIGIGILWIIRLQHPSARVPSREADESEPALPTGLALAVANRRYPHYQDMPLGTLTDLVRRGAVRPLSGDAGTLKFEALDRGRIRPLAHERLVLDHVAGVDHATTVSFDQLRRSLAKLSGHYRDALLSDLVAAGYADVDRMAVGSGLVRGGATAIALGLAVLVAVFVWMQRFGPWPVAIPVSVIAVGFSLVIRGGTFSILTPAGERVSAAWRRRLQAMHALKPAGKNAEAAALAELRRWLPEAVGSGQGETFAKKVDQHRALPDVLGLTIAPAFAPHD